MAPATMTVLMDAGADVQGYVLAIGFDNALVDVASITQSALVDGVGAELFASEVFPAEGGATLGIVLDAIAPFDGQVIAAGAGIEIATIDIVPLAPVTAPTDTPVTFVDGTFGSPVLNNILVQAGLSIGAGQGLVLGEGILTLLPPPPGKLEILDDTYIAEDGPEVISVPVLMDNEQAAQGFVLALTYSDGSFIGTTTAGTVTDTAGVEFEVETLYPGGVTLGVVLDFLAPFDGQVIPAGSGQHIASLEFAQECSVTADYDIAIDFVDGTLGSPPLDNVIVFAGLSINPELIGGVIDVDPADICGPLPPPGLAFFAFCGEGLPGSPVEICFAYTSEDANVQGFQLAVCFDEHLTFNDFSVDGTIVGETGAEFVNFDIDNADGEFIAGILLDALPPFDGQTVPPTVDPLLIGCVDATISLDAPCETELPVWFCNGIMANGSVAIENIMVIDFESIQDFDLLGCGVYVAPTPQFKRGDCNDDDKVDLADSAAVLGEQFFGYEVMCEDACDANDDGKINLADSVFLLNYLFKGGEIPDLPGPDMDGVDPTDDLLGCETTVCE